MSINIGIIDAQATKLATDLGPEFETRLGIKNDPIKQRSLSFGFMVVRALLDLTDDEALECLTEGGNDFGVDAIQYHAKALADLHTAINALYGNQPQSLQQLAATFRGGVLLEPGRLP